jgi:predicted RNA-binding protein with PUA-like domain
MAHWLLKSEPDDWSWAEQVAKGRDGAEWTGIRNFCATVASSNVKRSVPQSSRSTPGTLIRRPTP